MRYTYMRLKAAPTIDCWAVRRSARSEGKTARKICMGQSQAPLAFYGLNDAAAKLASSPSFTDAALVLVAFVAVLSALPFYPIPIAAVLLAILFAAAIYQPFIGLVLLLLFTLPAVAYQVPVLGWVFLLVIGVALVAGYVHYRTTTFIFALVALAFSPLGLLLEIPTFIMAILLVGLRRGLLLSATVVLAIAMISGTTGIQNSAYVLYDAKAAHSSLSPSSMLQYVTMESKPAFSSAGFMDGVGTTYSAFTTQAAMGSFGFGVVTLLSSLFTQQALAYLGQLAGLAVTVAAIEWIAASSRSKYKGTKAALAGASYPALYFAIGYAFHIG